MYKRRYEYKIRFEEEGMLEKLKAGGWALEDPETGERYEIVLRKIEGRKKSVLTEEDEKWLEEKLGG